MKKEILIPLIIITALLLRKPNEEESEELPPMRNEAIFFPPVDNPTIRNDVLGTGGFHSRTGGKHDGTDLITYEGQAIKSPITGYMVRIAYPYGSSEPWSGLLLRGTGLFAGIEVKIFYLTPTIVKFQNVIAGQTIGISQAISKRFDSRMIDHIHIEVTDGGRLVDPALYLFPIV